MPESVDLSELKAALRAEAAERMAQDSAHDLAHLDRVWTTAQALAHAEGGADLRVLLGGSYLHDLVNLPKDSPHRARASTMAASAAAPILRSHGFTNHEVAATQHAIATHSFSAGLKPKSLEARILRDADRLDALGAIGIARTFAVGGALGRALYDENDPFAEHRDLDDRAWALDHWPVKLFRLPEDMMTLAGKLTAEERVAEMRAYAQILAGELGRELPGGWR